MDYLKLLRTLYGTAPPQPEPDPPTPPGGKKANEPAVPEFTPEQQAYIDNTLIKTRLDRQERLIRAEYVDKAQLTQQERERLAALEEADAKRAEDEAKRQQEIDEEKGNYQNLIKAKDEAHEKQVAQLNEQLESERNDRRERILNDRVSKALLSQAEKLVPKAAEGLEAQLVRGVTISDNDPCYYKFRYIADGDNGEKVVIADDSGNLALNEQAEPMTDVEFMAAVLAQYPQNLKSEQRSGGGGSNQKGASSDLSERVKAAHALAMKTNKAGDKDAYMKLRQEEIEANQTG